MAVLAMVKLSGDPEKLLAAKRQFMDPVAAQVFPQHGHVWQVIARGDEELVIMNLWEDEEGREHANADPAMQEAREKIVAATGTNSEFTNWPVIDFKTTGH
ncbi:MAG TPA: hypothetical protein VJ838_01455 [Gaiellaceae bacterium]|nr:hypothetical protein [Gaiellaceae bacterium]